MKKQTLLFLFILFSTASYAQIIIIGRAPVVTGQPVAYQVVCNGSTATLSITASGIPGPTYQWYSNPRNGCEFCDILLTDGSQFSGTNTPSLSINTTGFFGGGTYYYCYVTNSWGTDYSQDGSIGVAYVPASPTTTGASSCVPASLTLSASPQGRGEYYNWYDQKGAIIPGETFMTYTTPVLTTTTNYFVALTTGTCESPWTGVTAQITTVTPPTTTGNSACGPSVVTLNASGLGRAGQYRWYTSSGLLIGGQTTSSYTTPFISTTTNYFVSIYNGTCESTRTSVTATINNPPKAPGATGNSACGSSAVTLDASGGTAGQYRWYTNAGALIAGQTNSSYTTPVISTTTNYFVSINNGTCESSKTSVTATINTPPAAPGAAGNSACGSSAVTLNASGGTAGQYRWYNNAGVLIAGQTNSSYTTPVISTTTNYFVSINNGICESSTTSVTATINTPPAAPTTIGASACSASSLALTAGGGSNGQFRWYNNDGTAIAGVVNNSYTTPIISATTVYYVSINNGNCESTKTSVLAQIILLSSPPSVVGGSSCGPSVITMTASGATEGQYRWYTVSSGGTAISGEFNSTYTTPLINATTTYYVSISNGTCESGRNSVNAQINTPPAAPVATGASGCAGVTVVLQASGGNPGQYIWYTSSTGDTSISGESNGTYTTPALSSTATYYVSIDNGTCESSRTSVIATMTACNNEPPVISTTTSATIPGGSVVIDLRLHISDPDNNLDFSTLKILTQPLSGANASLDANYNLTLDYQGLTFSGTDKLTIEICDLDNACSQQEFLVEVDGNIDAYNGVSPNGDGKNDAWIIRNIDTLKDTQVNHVSIFDRWGDSVFEIDNYDNVNRVFIGKNKDGSEVAAGTYFYKIEFKSGRKLDTGYFSLKR